ncbi:hypothetical protein XPA_007735 [Xanthoria parietina]
MVSGGESVLAQDGERGGFSGMLCCCLCRGRRLVGEARRIETTLERHIVRLPVRVPLTAHGNTKEMEEGAKEIVAAHFHSPGREGEIYAVPMVMDNGFFIHNDSPSQRKGQVKFNGVGRLGQVRGACRDGAEAAEGLRRLPTLVMMDCSLALGCWL